MKLRTIAGGIGLLCMSTWSLNKNQSIEFVQTLNRNASTSADAAFSNPAGLAFLPGEGWHVGGGNQIISQDRVVEEPTPLLKAYGASEYRGEIRVWAFPTVQAVYRQEDLALFVHGGPLGGGGKGEYSQGLPKFDNMILGFANQIGASVKGLVDTGYQRQLALASIPGVHVTNGGVQTLKYQRDLKFTGDLMTLGATLGAAYKIHPMVSVSAAYRYSYARNAYTGSAKPSKLGVAVVGSQGFALGGISGASIDSLVSAKANHAIDSLWRNVDVDMVSTGVSHGIVLGLDIKPAEEWNIGLRLEWNSDLELENTSSTLVAPDGLLPYLAAYAKGAKSKITEPVVLGGGLSWQALENLQLESSWTYGFYESVNRGGLQDHYRNSLFGGIGARYKLCADIETSLGYAYDWGYMENAARDETEFGLPVHYVSAGLGFQATPRLRLDGGVMLGMVQDGHGISVATGARQNMSSDHLGFGLGLQWSPAL